MVLLIIQVHGDDFKEEFQTLLHLQMMVYMRFQHLFTAYVVGQLQGWLVLPTGSEVHSSTLRDLNLLLHFVSQIVVM